VEILTADSSHSLEARDLPHGVRQAIRQQIEALPPKTQNSLALASVIGRDFGLDELAALSGAEVTLVEDQLGPAIAAGVLFRTTNQTSSLQFKHLLVRDVLYETLPVAECADLHASLALYLESRHGIGNREVATELAFHYRQGHRPSDALRYSLIAARESQAHLAYEDAPDNFRLALDDLMIAAPKDHGQRAAILIELATAELGCGERSKARGTIAEAVRLARDLHDSELLANAALSLAPDSLSIEVGVFDPDLVSLLEEALRSISKEQTVLRAQLKARLSLALVWTHQETRREILSSEALVEAERSGQVEAISLALLARHRCLWGPGLLAERLGVTKRACELGQETRNESFSLLAGILRITALLETGQRQELAEHVAEFTAKASQLGQPSYIWYSGLFTAMQRLLAGDFSKAEARAASFLAIGQRANDQNAEESYAAHIAFLRWEQGRLPDAIDLMQSFAAAHPSDPVWQCGVALGLTEAGQKQAARREFERLMEDGASSLPKNENWKTTICALSEICCSLEDSERASLLYSVMEPLVGEFAVTGYASVCWGAIDRILGNLAALVDENEKAESHYQEAIRRNRTIGTPPWLAHGQLDYAKFLLRADRRRTNEANVLVAEASSIASQLRMRRLRTRISGVR
jgi:tetratricopeptide (TPR) repeat protein